MTPVVGAPGCIKSPKTNVIDWILPRLLTGERLTRANLVSMGHGGLLQGHRRAPDAAQPDGLKHAPTPRPPPAQRDIWLNANPPRSPHCNGGKVLAQIILAAGLSSRMGENKVLLPWRDGQPLVAHVAAHIHGALGID